LVGLARPRSRWAGPFNGSWRRRGARAFFWLGHRVRLRRLPGDEAATVAAAGPMAQQEGRGLTRRKADCNLPDAIPLAFGTGGRVGNAPARAGLLAGSPRAEPNERDDLEGPLTRADLKRRRFRVRTLIFWPRGACRTCTKAKRDLKREDLRRRWRIGLPGVCEHW
jgi:hypothetical protein